MSDPMLSVETVRRMVAAIADDDDDESQHSEQDKLYVAVLIAIASGGTDDPAGTAREALKVLEIDFARWYA